MVSVCFIALGLRFDCSCVDVKYRSSREQYDAQCATITKNQSQIKIFLSFFLSFSILCVCLSRFFDIRRYAYTRACIRTHQYNCFTVLESEQSKPMNNFGIFSMKSYHFVFNSQSKPIQLIFLNIKLFTHFISFAYMVMKAALSIDIFLRNGSIGKYVQPFDIESQ